MPQTIDEVIVETTEDLERRATRRMPQLSMLCEGQLRIGGRKVPIEVIDESAGGFMVEAGRLPRNLAAKRLEISNHTGRHPVRVVWQRKVDSGKTRLGLQRMPELLEASPEPSWIIWVAVAFVAWVMLSYSVVASRPKFLQRILEGGAVINNELATPVSSKETPPLDAAPDARRGNTAESKTVEPNPAN